MKAIRDSAIYYSHIAFHYIHFGLLRHFSYYSHSKYMQIFCVAKSLYFGLLPRAGSLIRLVAQSCERTYKTSMPLLARIMSMQLYPGIDQQQQRNPHDKYSKPIQLTLRLTVTQLLPPGVSRRPTSMDAFVYRREYTYLLRTT